MGDDFLADYKWTEKKSSKKWKRGLTKTRKYSIIEGEERMPRREEPQRRIKSRGGQEATSEEGEKLPPH